MGLSAKDELEQKYRAKIAGIAGLAPGFCPILEQNPDCENLVNRVLAQLEKDTGVKLEGDIMHFLDEFASSGKLLARTHTPQGAGANSYGQEGADVDYKTPGWGFEITVSTRFFGNELGSFANTFVGEVIHTIGKRNGKSFFGDVEGAQAFANLGIGITLEEYINHPSMRDQIKKDAQGNDYVPGAASNLFHRVMAGTCSPIKGGYPFRGLRNSR